VHEEGESSEDDFTLSVSMKPGNFDKSGGKSAQTQKSAKPQESEARKRLAQLEAEMEREKQEKRRKEIMAQ